MVGTTHILSNKTNFLHVDLFYLINYEKMFIIRYLKHSLVIN